MTRYAAKPSLESLPSHIADRLRQLMRRARALAAARGAAITIATFVSGMLVAVAADLFIPMVWPASAIFFTPPVRVAMSFLVLLATMAVAGWMLLGPLNRRYSLTAAAMALEKDHPELQERISTTVELMLTDSPDAFRGSDEMIRAVAAAADVDSQRISHRQAVRATRAGRAWLTAGVLLAGVIAAAAFWPAHFQLYVQRFVAPWNDMAQFRWTSVESVTADCETARGERMTIEARSSGRIRAQSATIYIEWADGKRYSTPVDPSAVDGNTTTFQFKIDRVRDSFTYHIRVNDGVTRGYRVTAVDRPAVECIDLHYAPPAYTAEPERHEPNAYSAIKALRHTMVSVDLAANRELDVANSFLVFYPDASDLSADTGKEVLLPLSPLGSNRYRASFELLENGRYDFMLRGGPLANVRLPAESRPTVSVEADQRPTVEILIPGPNDKVALRPDDSLNIGYETGDDYGLSRLAIAYSTDGGTKWKQVPATMPDGTSRRARASVPFDLKRLGEDLSPYTEIRCKLIVSDNLPVKFGGPQVAESSVRTIKLDPKLSPYAERMLATLREQFADAVADILRQLKLAQADVNAIRKDLPEQPMLDEKQDRLTQSAMDRLSKANELALAAGARTDFSQYVRMGERLEDIAGNHIQPANRLMGQSREFRTADQVQPRSDKLVQADFHIKRAIDLLSAVGQEFTDLLKMERAADVLSDLQEKQAELADALAEEIRDPNKLAEFQKEQAELLELSRQLLKDNPKSAAEPLYDIAAEKQKTLNEKIREVADKQKKLMDETALASKLQELDRRAADLAAKQADLAKTQDKVEADHAAALAKADAPSDVDKPMSEAAKALSDKDLKTAIDKQEQANRQLDQTAAKIDKSVEDLTPKADYRQMGSDRKASDYDKQMAEQARKLEKHQADLAEQTDQARQAADKAAAKAEQSARKSDQQVADLARKQEAVAARSEQVQKQAAEKLTPSDAATAKKSDSTPSAKQAAEQLNKKSPAQAAAPGQQSEQHARNLERAMEQSAKVHEDAARKADQEAAAATDPAAKQAAEQRARQERQAAQAAREIAQQARQLGDAQAEVNKQLPSARQAADQAAADKAAADKAKQPLAEAGQKQKALAGEVNALQQRMAQANEDSRKLANEHNAAKPAGEAAADLPAKPADAVKAQQQAARKLAELAKGLDEAGKNAAEKAAQAQAAMNDLKAARQAKAAADNIKQRQQQLAEQTRQLADDMAKAQQELRDQQLADLAKQQGDVAERAAELAEAVARQPADADGNPQPPQPNPAADKGAAAARQAWEKLAENKLPEAGKHGQQAAGQLQELAKQLAQNAGKQAGVDPQRQQQQAMQAAEAGKLADQQKQINEQLANLDKNDPQANLPLRQDAVREETKELGEQAKLVADFMEQLAPAAGQAAKQAAAQLAEQAPAAQAQAAQAMRAGQMPQAKAAQQQAAAAAERADQLFQQAARQAAAAAEAAQPGDQQAVENPDPQDAGEPAKAEKQDPYDPLAEAAWAENEAKSAIKEASDAAAAKQSLEQQIAQAKAAAAAAEAARQLGQAQQQMAQAVVSMSSMPSQNDQPGQPGQPAQNFSPPWFSTTGTSGKAPDMRRLNFELGLTGSEWNRLPGYLQQAIIQASGEKVPQEYRELVKRYFQTISQDSGGK